MKKEAPNQYRQRNGPIATDDNDGMKGMFFIPFNGEIINVLVNYAEGDNQHISMNANRQLTSDEIKQITMFFWDESEIKNIVWHTTKSTFRMNSHIIHVVDREEYMSFLAVTKNGIFTAADEPNEF